MKNNTRKRGRKFLRKFTRASVKASQEGKEHIKENLLGRFSHIIDIRLLIVEWSLLVIVLVLLAVTQAFWYADSYSENTFVEGGTYIEATLGEVDSMNPLFATTNSERVLSRLMFATLSEIDYSGHPGIGLAKYISPNEDSTVWTMKLKDGLKWSDGEPITNEDVLFTVDLIKNPVVNTVYSSNLSRVKVSENKEGEIVFELPMPYTGFISALNFPIVPKHILSEVDPQTLVEHSFSKTPVTSGPFRFNALQTTSIDGEDIIYLSVNPDYYKGKILLNGFAIHDYLSREEIIDAINTGAVTATAELSEADTERITTSQFSFKNASLNSGTFLFFNTSSEKLRNPELRSAIRQGINLDEIRSIVPNTVALDYPLLSAQISLSNYPEIPKYDLENAKSKINELRPEDYGHINMATINYGYLPNVAEVLKTKLENLGFVVDLTKYEENQEFFSNVISKRGYDILVYEVELGADPDLLPYYHSSQANGSGLNLSNFRNSLADDLLLGARNATDEKMRALKYESFLEIWASTTPAIGLYQPNLTYYYNKNTRSFSSDASLVTALDRFVDVNNWAVSKDTKNKTP